MRALPNTASSPCMYMTTGSVSVTPPGGNLTTDPASFSTLPAGRKMRSQVLPTGPPGTVRSWTLTSMEVSTARTLSTDFPCLADVLRGVDGTFVVAKAWAGLDAGEVAIFDMRPSCCGGRSSDMCHLTALERAVAAAVSTTWLQRCEAAHVVWLRRGRP